MSKPHASGPSAGEAPSGAGSEAEAGYHGVGFWLAVFVGLLAITYGLSEYFSVYPDVERRLDLARWIVGSAIVHDLLLAPVVVLIGSALSRLAPPLLRAPVAAGCVASGLVLLVAWHPLRHTAAAKNNPTIQPLDYRTSTLTVLALVWSVALVWTALRWRANHRTARR